MSTSTAVSGDKKGVAILSMLTKLRNNAKKQISTENV